MALALIMRLSSHHRFHCTLKLKEEEEEEKKRKRETKRPEESRKSLPRLIPNNLEKSIPTSHSQGSNVSLTNNRHQAFGFPIAHHPFPVLVLFIKYESIITLHSCLCPLHQVSVSSDTTLMFLSSSSSAIPQLHSCPCLFHQVRFHNYTPALVLFIKCESTTTLLPLSSTMFYNVPLMFLSSSSSAIPQLHSCPCPLHQV